jgi:hypothetical protein
LKAKIALLILGILLTSCSPAEWVQWYVPTSMQSEVETPSDPPLPAVCIQFSLTPEECANAGVHDYSAEQTIYTEIGIYTETLNSTSANILFTSNSVSLGDGFSFNRTDANTFTRNDEHFSYILTFTESGYTLDYKVAGNYSCSKVTGKGSCGWNHKIEYTIRK